MKKGIFSLMMGLILAFTGLANAQTEVTIGAGTSNSYLVPYNSLYNYSFNEMIWTADEILEAGGSAGQIIDIAFQRASGTAQTNTYTVYMKNVSRSSFSSTSDYETVTSGDIVFNGTHYSSTTDWETVTLNTPFAWDGSSNLMIAVWEQTGTYNTENYYYSSVSNNCMIQFYSDSYNPNPYSLGSYSGSIYTRTYHANLRMNILSSGPQPIQVVVTSPMMDEQGVINFGDRPSECWMRPAVVSITNNGARTHVTGIDFTNNYFTPVLGEDYVIPFAIGRGETVDFNVEFGTGTGLMEGVLDVDCGDARTAILTDVMANAYQPVCPDVWELARVISNPEDYRDTPTTVTLYNNYVLPPAAVEDGNDAVYKVTFDHDVMLNGNVVTVGGIDMAENGKMAVYREGFEGVGGPDLNNNYTGPQIGGGSQPYDVVFGDETTTSTTSYYPCYYLYNYSLSESLYHAEDLQAAGMGAGVITGIGYNSTSTYGYTVNGVKIWMANVTDTEAGTTSHSAAGMTCVYEGSFTQVQGWNEFALNGAFAWDGSSNLLVIFQMNNGSWSSAISWKYVSTDYVAGFVDFNDNNPYSPETNTYTYYYNHSMLPVTHFVGGGRDNRETNTLTVADGTATDSRVPVYGYNADSDLCAQYIIPAGDLTAMSGSQINSLTYYASSAPSSAWNGTFTVYMAEVSNTAPTSLVNRSSCTTVYTGSLNATSGTMTINLSTPYTYNGGNLLIGFDQNTGANYSSVTWMGTDPGYAASLYGYSWGELSYGGNWDGSLYFIPKTTFTYEAGSGPEPPVPPVPGDQLITNMTMLPGTYYIAASSTADAWDVILNASELPCPDEITAANCVQPADDSDGIDPTAVTLKWRLSPYTTEYRLLFGSTYYCENVLVDWTRDLAESFTVRNLFNNTNYFWRIEERNDGCPQGVVGPVWGFTTTFNAPTNLHATNANGANIYEGETLNLAWTPIVDRTFRSYNVYMDGELIGSTPSNPNPAATTTFDVEGLTYTYPGFHIFNVTAVYDEGESWISNDLLVTISGEGEVEGYVYEQDGVTGIAGATVTMTGIDEFGRPHTYTFTTDANGHYTGAMLAGEYSGVATCTGYQDVAYEENPFAIVYDELTPDINFIMDEVYYPVGEVIAEYYPDPEDPESPYVKVYWSWNIMSAMIEDFETGDFSQYDWNIPAQYPFEITTTNPYEGAYCMQSTNYNVASSTSSIDVTVEIPRDGLMSFYKRISCESSWDMAYFYIDGAQVATFTGTSGWGVKEVAVTEGTHNFKWAYTKDSSVNSGEDRFFIDYIDFIHDAQPVGAGWHTYLEGEFDNAYVSNVGTPSWGYEYPASVISSYAGMNMTKVALFSDDMYGAVGGTFTCNVYQGGATPAAGTLVSSITVDVPAGVGDWVEFDLTTPVSVNSDPLYVLWTADVIGGLGYPAGCASHPSTYGDWWNPGDGSGWSHMGDCTWTMKNYFSDRSGRGFWASSENANQAIQPMGNLDSKLRTYAKGEEVNNGAACINPNATFKATANSNDRSFQYFRVYRTDCYNDGPYTFENTVVCCCELHDTLYIDVEWPDLAPGVYKWGVGCVYGGNRGEEVESPITWATVENNSVENVMAYEPATAPGMEQLTGIRTAPAKFHEIKSSNPFRGSTGYVDNTYGYVIPSGLCVMDMDNPQGATSLNPSSSLYAGEIVDGVIYGYTSDGYFVTFDPETGAQLSSVYAGTGIREMAYDYTTSTMYGSSTSDNNLYRIDMTNGSYTVVGTMSNVSAVAGLVCDLTGQLYAMAFTTGDLYKVDKNTAAMTLVGNTGRTPAYVQSAAIDYATGICYWAYSDASYDDLYTVDLATAQASFVCSFVESCGLCFPRAGAPVPPGPDPQHSEIQEPRESPIVWSNCLDKDMYLNGAVDITVLLNSADSPEGTTVAFRNLNEFEQELYPVETVTLDSTGYYVWDSFRRGEYEVTISHDGYETITEEVNIMNATSMRYVMIEIIYGVSDLYVSHTGWAMWAGQDGPVPPHGDGDTFEFGFDSGLDGWTTINADGDDHNWYHSSEAGNHSTLAITSHSGAGHMMSESYCNATWAALHPDEYLVAPQMYNIAAGSTFSFWACAQDASYAAEHFGVAISTTGNTNAADFTTIQEWTLTAKGGAKANPAATRDGEGTREGNWYQYTCDLSAYAGQQVWIAIRHFGCTDQFIMCMDDAELTTGAKSDERHLEGYKVLCTSIDGEPIFSGNTVHPFCQVDTDELVEGENYICKVAAIYSTGMSDWTVAEWQYKSCENYGEAQNVAAEGQTITWEYPAGPVPPPIGDGDEFSFSFDSNADGWTTINADGDDHNWYHSSEAGNHSTLAITSHSGAGHMMSESYCNATWAALTPDEYLVAPQMYGIAAGSTFSFWACAQDASYAAEHFGVAISTTGNTNAADFTTIQEWTLTAKGGAKANPAATRDGEGTREGNWYQYTCDLSAYAGQQVWIAIRHFGCTDMFIMCMDDAQLTAGAKSNRDEYIQYCTETFSGGVGTGGGEVWWAVKFPASSLASYAGQTLTKLGVFTDVDGDYGWTYSGNYELSVYAGTSAPTTLLGTTGMQYVAGDLAWHDLDLQAPVTIEGTQDLWIMGHTLNIAYPMSGCDYVGDANSDYLSLDGSLWEHANDYGLAYTWMLRGLVGGSQPGPGPEPTGEVIGAMIFRDGEWLAEVPYPVSEYTDEEGSGNYCVRIIYNGTAVLPDQNEYYSMSCPVCTESDDCAPGADIYGEYVWNNANDYGALITWGGAPVPPPGPGDEFTEGFESGSIPTGWTTIDADGDGHNWSPASVLMAGYLIPAHGGADCFTSESYSSTYGALTPDNFLVSPQVAIANGSQFSFWACAQDPSYAGEHYGVAISTTGNTNAADFTTIAEWTMTAKDAAEAGACMSKDGKGTREGTWYQKTVDLSDYAGQQIYIAIRHFNCTDMFYLNVDDAELSIGAKASLANAVKYNVYRSTDNVNYTFIGEVPVVTGQTEYSYFDNEVAAGLYYYQVRAEYSDGCESAPAASGANPDNNYVIVNVTSVAENGEIALYPNPTNGNITIQAQNMNRITVVSVLGQVVYDAEVEGEQQIINMAQFNAGVYMVRIATENGVSTQRVTVVK